MESIAITEIPGFKIGQVEDAQGGTGVTAIMRPEGMAAGIDVRGGGPASRDTRVLDPLAAAERIHAVLLAGGSAFGLDAAGGAMRYLEERGIGVEIGPVHVPLVCQSNIFDLLVGDPSARPDAAMGYAACQAAEAGNYRDGNYGAGCGATVGKALGADFAVKTGIGSAAVRSGELYVGAIAVVNALGDVRDPATGQTIAGLRDAKGDGFRSTDEMLCALYEAAAAPRATDAVANTTIGAILTNADLAKGQLCKVAAMAHDGLARTISPVHTAMDGDSIYALSTSETPADTDRVGIIAADVMARAILCAVRSAAPAFGLPSAL